MATTQIPRLQGSTRDSLGKRNNIRLRKSGQIPAVIYGHKQNPVHISVDRKAFIELAHRNVHVLELAVGSAAEPVLIKELQWDHLGSTIVHIDLTRVDLNEKVTLSVAIVLTGDAIGTKEAGAFLQPFLAEIEIECLATQIPENIKADVSHLKVGEHLEVKDIKLPEGVVAVTDGHTAVAGVVVIKEEEAPAAGATGAEPEVIGKKVEEGAEAAAGDAKKAEGKK